MKFWKEHPALRMVIMATTFVIGMILLIVGWKMQGQMNGLLIMIVGVILMLICLGVYNQRFQ